MKIFLFMALIVIVVITYGCVGGNKNTIVTPTQTTQAPTIIVTTTVPTTVLTISQTIAQKDPLIGVWRYINSDGYDFRYRFNADGTFVTSGYSPEYKQTVVLYGNWRAQGGNLYIVSAESQEPDNYLYVPERNIFYNSKFKDLIFKPYRRCGQPHHQRDFNLENRCFINVTFFRLLHRNVPSS